MRMIIYKSEQKDCTYVVLKIFKLKFNWALSRKDIVNKSIKFRITYFLFRNLK